MEDMIFEAEGAPEAPQRDTIWIKDGRGRLIEQEVADDDDA